MSKKKKYPATSRGDEQIVADGGAPESVVAEWWDALTVEQRRDVGKKVAGDLYPIEEWDSLWDELMPIGQQMRVHMHYDATRG